MGGNMCTNQDVAVLVMGIEEIPFDAMVAETRRVWSVQPACTSFLLGFDAYQSVDGPVYQQRFRNYLEDAEADFEVLQHVRDAWSERDQVDFVFELAVELEARVSGDRLESTSHAGALFYEVGDYSRAAVKVVSHKMAGKRRS
jgi:hypothetical protein